MEEDLKSLLRELELLEHIKGERKKQRGMEYYTPNAHQLKAHQSNARFVLLCGANRIGKSTFGCMELVFHCTRRYPTWFSQKRRFNKPIKAVVVCEENQFIEKVIEPKIRQYMPPDYVQQWKRVTGGYLNRIVCKDGSVVDFLTNEQADMAFEGADWDFFWGDEPQRKRKFEAIQRGLVDRRGIGVITFTPLIEPWMKEEMVDKADGVHVECITAQMRDNLFDIKGNAILSKETIDDFERGLSEDVRETRIYGKFFHLRGVVYTEFSEVHQIRFDYTYPDPVIAVLDPHDRQPHHVIWAVVDRTDDLFVHSEMTIHCTVQELATKIRNHETKMGYKMRKRLIDPNFGRKPLITTGRNMIEELAISGCNGWFEADDPKDEGRLKVKEYLHYDKSKPVSHTNRPKIFFHKDRVPLTIHSIRNHQYEEWIGKTADEKDPKEKSKDKDTHGADCIRYLCMSNPRFTRMYERQYELDTAPY